MKTVFLLIFALSTTATIACGDYASLSQPETLSHIAVSADRTRAEAAIRKLRALGPEGLESFLNVHAAALTGAAAIEPALRIALEAISGQRDASASRLFWHTDLAQARDLAQKLNRPILSLRLLGRLDEELSCANSRFFRIALYPNKEVNEILRSNFVLHWESVRPAPRITVDFGDGRKIERTITGNSIHYILAPDGQPIDALPGLYGPKAFLAQLRAAFDLAGAYSTAKTSSKPGLLRQHHASRLASALSSWSADLARVEGGQSNPAKSELLRNELEARTTSERWSALAMLHYLDTTGQLDDESRKLMRAKNPRAVDAGRIAVSKSISEDPLLRAIGEFQRSMAEDTVRNEYQLHTRIHEWFSQGDSATHDVARLNNRVYAELFLTPHSDPWLGLRPPNSYSGAEADGVSLAATPTRP